MDEKEFEYAVPENFSTMSSEEQANWFKERDKHFKAFLKVDSLVEENNKLKTIAVESEESKLLKDINSDYVDTIKTIAKSMGGVTKENLDKIKNDDKFKSWFTPKEVTPTISQGEVMDTIAKLMKTNETKQVQNQEKKVEEVSKGIVGETDPHKIAMLLKQNGVSIKDLKKVMK